jgi:hypothetical protein
VLLLIHQPDSRGAGKESVSWELGTERKGIYLQRDRESLVGLCLEGLTGLLDPVSVFLKILRMIETPIHGYLKLMWNSGSLIYFVSNGQVAQVE